MIIAITGLPGSGKTTLAHKLAQQTDYTYLSIHELAQKTGNIEGVDQERQVDIIDEEKLETEIKKLSGNILLDGHFSHNFTVDKIILVACARPELVKRMQARNYSKQKVLENLDAANFKVIEEEIDERSVQVPVLVVNTTNGYTPEIKEIEEFINA